MKKHIISLIALISIAIFSGCESYLDVRPDYGLGREDIFVDYYSVRSYLDPCYRALEDYLNWQSQGGEAEFAWVQALGDEAVMNYKHCAIRNIFNTGSWYNNDGVVEIGINGGNTLTATGKPLTNAFHSIRIANDVLAEVEAMTNLTGEERDLLNGQAFFMRAWYYFQIIKRWGGMFIIDRVIAPSDDYDYERLTYHESTEWLISDLDRAIELLPDAWPENEMGRATKVAAMAVKSMAQLYDASPTMCPENGYRYDLERCKKAAEYAADVLKYLAENPQLPYEFLDGTTPDNYRKLFYTDQNVLFSKEHLWYRHNGASQGGNRDAMTSNRVLWQNAKMNNATGFWAAMYLGPTQNVVDMFEVEVGGKAYSIDDPDIDFDMGPDYFNNRDPRLHYNLIYTGCPAFGQTNTGPFYMTFYPANSSLSLAVGNDWNQHITISSIKDQMGTGYLFKKWLWPEAIHSSPVKNINLYNYNAAYIRIAQIYLDYAEAMNEAYGPNSDPEGYGLTAVQAVNMVRRRVGWLDVNSKYTSDADTFRERIRNERAVELMFENHRWWDLRRWRIAEEVFQKPLRGLVANVTALNGSNTPSDWTYNYQSRDLTTENRIFKTRHYWYPIPSKYEEEFVNFKQNEGW